jgi:transketolase
VQTVNGNDVGTVIEAVSKAQAEFLKPSVIIANTVPSKGVSFMENKWQWHGKPISEEEVEIALKDLKIEN